MRHCPIVSQRGCGVAPARDGCVVSASWVRPVTAIALAMTLVAAAPGAAIAQTPGSQDLKRLSLEELLRVEISTVTRVPEPTSAVPAAVFVITQDDIRRSGAVSLPEVLRLAPGLQVAQQDAARFAIGARGFADRLARSMLVLIDGRAVYSPLFAGTYWEVQDTMLEDIERIEVVRGPGGTLWGANAVNGIINIITKRAQDTPGALISGTLGSDVRGPVAVRYGRAAGKSGAVRAYAKAFDRDLQLQAAGPDDDDWRMIQAGVRGDWTLSAAKRLTVQGDVYQGDLAQRVNTLLAVAPFSLPSTRTAALSGGNVLARWVSPIRHGEYQVQAYYDRTSRDERPVAETRDRLDVDLQHRQRLGPRHGLVWGAGYRVTSGRITATAPTAFIPPDRTDTLVTAFAQDDVAIVPDRLRLIVGTKVEHNDYSGFEIQPSARMMWALNGAHGVFGAVTRAVRTPSRVETDYTTTSLSNPAVPAFVRLQPNPAFAPEKLTAYEAGYRLALPSAYLTASAFFNQFDDTLSTELLTTFVETTPPPARLILPVTFANGLHGNSHGLEVTGDVRPAAWWRVTANYSWLRVQMTRSAGSADVSQERRYEGLTPQHQVQVSSSLSLPHRVSVDWFVRYVSELPAGAVASYGASTIRAAWQPSAQVEIAATGQNLHAARHFEWPASSGGVPVRRRAYVTLTWRQR